MKKLIACSFAMSLLLVTDLSHAAQEETGYARKISRSTFQLPLNSSRLVFLRKGETVGTSSDPSIASIDYDYLKTGHHLLIRGKGLGTTNIILLNKKNQISRTLNIQITKNLDDLKKQLYMYLPDENISVTNAQGNIILSGQVSNLANMDLAMRLAQAYTTSPNQSSNASSNNIGTNTSTSGVQNGIVNMMQIGGGQQVMLEVKIAEVSRSLTRKLKISRSAGTPANSGGASDFIWSALTAAAGVFTGSYITGDVLFNWTLDFSKDTGLSTLLAEPNLTTLSGQKASFLSGGEFPYQACSQSLNNATCNIAFKEFGVGLEFLPTVLDSSKINLSTHVSVSSLNNKAAEITGVETNTPSLAVREAQTTIELADGQTMSIAGLLSDDTTNNQSMIPGLADLPFIGQFFRNREATSDQKELVILVTPHLAKALPKDLIRLPTDAFVEPDDVDFYLLGKMESRDVRPAQIENLSQGGVSGQFGHQINEEVGFL